MSRIAFTLVLIALLIPTAGATLATQSSKGTVVEKQRFVIYYTPGPHWLAGKPIYDQPLHAHGDYMHTLFSKGTLFMGGPLTDSSGGLVIIDVADEKEAQSVIDADPAVHAGIFKAAAHPWYPVDWQSYGK